MRYRGCSDSSLQDLCKTPFCGPRSVYPLKVVISCGFTLLLCWKSLDEQLKNRKISFKGWVGGFDCTISLQSSRGIILWSKCLLRYVIGKKRNDTSTGGRGPAATWRRDAHLARRVADGARRDADHGKPPCQQRRPWPFASLSTPRSARRWRDLKTMTICISLIKGGPRSWLAYLINWESSKAHELENKIVQVISTKAHELENKIVQVISTALAGHRVCMQTDHVICFPLRDY
jgi:hypothetical protein